MCCSPKLQPFADTDKIAIIATPKVFNDNQLILKLVRLTQIGVPCMMLGSMVSQEISLPYKIRDAGGPIAQQKWQEKADRTVIMLDIKSHATTVVSAKLPANTTLMGLEKGEQKLEFIALFLERLLYRDEGHR